MQECEFELLRSIKNECLNIILGLYKQANAGHIGSSLSCLDALIYFYFHFMDKEDKFILSKGHAALALYVVLKRKGLITKELLETFYSNGTFLSAHPPFNHRLDCIPFGTGSLGHGLSLAAGFALSTRFTNKPGRVLCLLSEGDCDEGSTWEAALFASQHHLKNLFVILDYNNLQGFGKSPDVLNLEPIKEKWESFNFEVFVADDGNDFHSLNTSFEVLKNLPSEKPKCIIAKTKKGNGISFMENKLEWHYLPMTDEQYIQAMKEINN
jgi:transketolase